MRFIKNSLLLLIFSILFLSFTPELSAKSHRGYKHHRKNYSSTSLSLNMNVGAPARTYYAPQPVYYNPGYTTVVTHYQQPSYYEQVTVVKPYPVALPVQQVYVQPEPRPTFGFSFSPFFSFCSR